MREYQDNLRHLAEPASPAERREANSTTIEDYEALWFVQVLRGYADYGAESGERADIARAYVEYSNNKVRDGNNNRVTLYAHTPKAVAVLQEALWYATDMEWGNVEASLTSALSDSVAELKAES